MRALSSYFFITLGDPDFENISLSDMLNLRDVSEHINCQWQLSCWGLWEFVVRDSKGIIFKTKHFLSFRCSIFGIYIKFWRFSKKKMILIASLFWKLQTVKDLLRRLFKKHSFGDPRLENISLSDMLNLRGLS